MVLGWTLGGDAEYNVPWDTRLSERQAELLGLLLGSHHLLYGGNDVGETLRKALKAFCSERKIRYDESWAEKLVFLALLNISSFGVLSYFLGDDQLEEIAVVGIGKPIYVFDRRRGWLRTNASITSVDFAVDCVNAMARHLGRRLTYHQPRLNAVLQDGSRLHACVPPIALDGIEITLRKFRKKPFTLGELAKSGFLKPEEAALLGMAFESDCSVLVAGNTGSGKTTLLNALSAHVAPSERVVLIEDCPELQWQHPHLVRLVSGEHPLGELVSDSLRMRPDRVVVGEVRSPEEAQALFNVLLAGHAKGAYATFHAESAEDALSRFEFLGVRKRDLQALDLVAVLKRFSCANERRQNRKLSELCFVGASGAKSAFGVTDVSDDFFESKAFKKISLSHGLTPASFEAEIRRRARVLA